MTGMRTGTERRDGRRARSEQSRDAIADALLALLREGNPRPGARDIAARAKVSLRSVFRHFDDLDDLFTAVADRQSARTSHLFELRASGTLEQRIHQLATQRAVLFEEVAPMRRAALRLAPFHPPLCKRLDESNAVLRRHIPEVFAAELDAVGAADRRDLTEAIEAVTGWAHWETLRNDQRLGPERARRIVERTLGALLRR